MQHVTTQLKSYGDLRLNVTDGSGSACQWFNFTSKIFSRFHFVFQGWSFPTNLLPPAPITDQIGENILQFLSFFLTSDRKGQIILFSSNSFFLFVELFVDLDPLGDKAQQVEISQEAGGVVEHPRLAVVVAVVGTAAVVSTQQLQWRLWLRLRLWLTSAGGWWRWSREPDRPRLRLPRWSRRRPGLLCSPLASLQW